MKMSHPYDVWEEDTADVMQFGVCCVCSSFMDFSQFQYSSYFTLSSFEGPNHQSRDGKNNRFFDASRFSRTIPSLNGENINNLKQI